jgi:hypothetical protein
MIFIFRQYDSQKRIIIYAESYLEAKETLFELNPWADRVYNILEYKMYNVDDAIYHDTLKLEYDMGGYPRIISEDEFKELEKNKAILNEQFNNIHNTKVLTKKFAGENTNLLSTEEFVGQLKSHAKSIGKIKKNIYQMMRVVGDVWVKEIKIKSLIGLPLYRVYGKSRYQCEKLLNDLIEKTNINFDYSLPAELLIKDFNDLNENDVSNYMMMIDYMKENNINKFPFSTYKEEEQ